MWPEAWQELARIERRRGRHAQALEALDHANALHSSSASDDLRLLQAEILLESGRLDEARQVASELGQPIYRDLIAGRVLLEEGDAEGALEAFEAGLLHWPNNPGARFGAGFAAQQMGRSEKALAHYREAVRIDPAATDAALLMAEILAARGELAGSRSYARIHLQRRDAESTRAQQIADPKGETPH